MDKILFVCTGNICRSPTANGLLQHAIATHNLENKLYSDSAGTTSYHVGESPDPRAIALAQKHGIPLHHITARQVHHSDFDHFDRIIAMDSGHYEHLKALAPTKDAHKVKLFLPYTGQPHLTDVPDPYYSNEAAFEHMFELIKSGIDRLINPYI